MWDASLALPNTDQNENTYPPPQTGLPQGRRVTSGDAENKGHTKGVYHVTISPDGTQVVTGSSGGTAQIWNGRIPQIFPQFKGHTSKVVSVAVSADGTRVVTGSDAGGVRIWDAHTGQSLTEFQGDGADELGVSVGISADGMRVVAGSQAGYVRIWDARTGQVLTELKGVAAWHAEISAAGARVVTREREAARVWDAATGKHLPDAPIPPLTQPTSTTPDGQYRFVPVGNRVQRVDARPDESELHYRHWLTRPDPKWHAQRAKELEAEGNTYGAAIQRAAERRAMGVVAFDFGDLQQAHAHFLEAALLMPKPPKFLDVAPPPRPVMH